jgi:hypothetical protein
MGSEKIRMKWETRIQAFRASGERATHWCKDNHINRRQLYTWLKRLDGTPSTSQVKPAIFIPVQVTSEMKAVPSNRLRVRIGSVVIEVESGFEPALLRQVIHALEGDLSC